MAARYWVGGHPTNNNWNQTGSGTTNWAATSGGTAGASVPTSADDVTFDSGGNSSSIISASITVLSLTITSGYTATMTHNAVLTVAGNITLGANYTIAGTSAMTINTTSTITSNGKTWPNNMTFSGSGTAKTLIGDLTISGTLTITLSYVNKTTSEKLYCNGLTYTGGTPTATPSAIIQITGGTWSASGISSAINPIEINGNVTVSGNVYINSTSLTYISGSVITTGSTLILRAGTTILDTSGITWNIISTQASAVFDLQSLLSADTIDLTASGAAVIFTGISPFTVNSLISDISSVQSTTLVNSLTYTINSLFRCSSSRVGSIVIFISDHGSNKAIINFPNNGTNTCDVLASFTRIEVTGRSVNTFAGTVTDCINVNQFYDYKGTAI